MQVSQVHAFRVDGMTCQHCVTRVQALLSSVAGVRHVTVDLMPPRAHVNGDDVDILINIIADTPTIYYKNRGTAIVGAPTVTMTGVYGKLKIPTDVFKFRYANLQISGFTNITYTFE